MSIPKEPQPDYSNGGRLNHGEVEKWIAEAGLVIESRMLDLKTRLELSNDGRAFLETIQHADGRNDNNTPFPVFSWKGEEGATAFIKLGIAPEQSKWNVEGARLVIKGKTSLGGSEEWQTVTDENKTAMHFFRVEVQLP